MLIFCYSQARQVLEREFNNLLALGTDRRLDDVSTKPLPPLDHAERLFLRKKQERQDLYSLLVQGSQIVPHKLFRAVT